MKSPFFKSLLVAGALVCAWNCTDDNITVPTPQGGDQFAAVTIPSWILEGDQKYIITPTEAGFVVSTASGTPIGAYDPASGTVLDAAGTPIATVPDLSQLPVITPDQTIIYPNGTITDLSGNPISQPVDPNQGQGGEDPNQGGQGGQDPIISSSETPVIPTSSATTLPDQPTSSSSVQQEQPKSSSSVQQEQPKSSATSSNCDGKCFDAPSNSCVAYYASLKGPHEEQYAYDKTCALNCYYDPKGKDCKDMGASTQQPKSSSSVKSSSSQQQQPKSSSSVKSSSSSAKSSSSSAKSSSSTGGNSGTYQIKYVNGGKSGDGYATRYWDCCKPHCAWPEHGGTASTCDARGNKIGDKGASSMCDGGNAGICRSQFPIVINDTLAFAFAATPGGENNCGKCFDLAFTGQGKYATDNHSKLKGKHLIVMSNNVGYDVAGGQFDVMIPGGGYGIFNGCSQKMGWGSQGSQYGGLLDQCEQESNYKASTYKSCLQKKCESSFSSDPEAKEGCLFMANWMNAAGNPLLKYKEVECPQELKDRY